MSLPVGIALGLTGFAAMLGLLIIAPEAVAFVRYICACGRRWFD